MIWFELTIRQKMKWKGNKQIGREELGGSLKQMQPTQSKIAGKEHNSLGFNKTGPYDK